MRSSRFRLPILVLLAVGLGVFAWSDGRDIAGGDTADAMDVSVGAARSTWVQLKSAKLEQQIPVEVPSRPPKNSPPPPRGGVGGGGSRQQDPKFNNSFDRHTPPLAPPRQGEGDKIRAKNQFQQAAGSMYRQAGTSHSPNPIAGLPKERLQQTLARPLFSPSRRPPPPKVKPRKAPRALLRVKKPARMDLALVGILSADSNAIAVLRHKKASRSYSVREGDMVAGWRVRTITASSVVLVGKSRSFTLPLFKTKTL